MRSAGGLPGNAPAAAQHAAAINAASEGVAPRPGALAVVIDTNIILDVFVFSDVAAKPVRQALEAGELDWLATQPMRDELARVLDYPQIVPRLAFYGLTAANVLAAFDHHATQVPPAPRAPVRCSDPDDQIFIDLAVTHRCPLLSKDRAVLALKKRLAPLGVLAACAFDAPTLAGFTPG